MAAKTSQTQDAVADPVRTEPIEVTNSEQALSLLAAWRGVFNFFKGQVTSWGLNDDGTVVAHGFSVEAPYDAETILRDISGRDRRIDFPSALKVFQGGDPDPYTDPSDMQNFMVNFSKGSADTGTSKTPEYVRKAVASYKLEIGLPGRRGRKRSILRLDNINDLDETALSGRTAEEIDKLIAIATAAKSRNATNVATNVSTNA